MCTGIELGLAAASVGAALFGSGGDKSTPPPVAMPAAVPDGPHDPNAVVRVGDGTKPKDATTTPQYDGFTEKRVTGTPLGGLGRGGLGL